MDRRLNVVIVNEGLPYPPTAGNRIRTLNLMLRLAKRHRITYVCRGDADGEEERQAINYLREHGIRSRIIGPPALKKSGVGFYARLACNVLSPLPYAVAAHNSPAVRRAVGELAAQEPVDLWQFEWCAYADAAPAETPRIVMAHNVESLIWQRFHENEGFALRRWFYWQQWRKFERFERRIFAGVTRVVTVSPDDARLVRDRFEVDHVDIVENGIDRGFFERVEGRRDPKRILFLGSLEWRPNLDAVGLLLDRIFPAVLSQIPDAQLVIVGRRPPEKLVRRIKQLPNVALHADVDDVRPFLGDCGVMAVPLCIGGGSRLKILEALAGGMPVVASRVGAEGLELTPGEDLLMVERAENLADALVQSIRRPDEARRTAERGRRLVLERYDWDVLAGKLEAVWWNCLRSRSAQPAAALRR
jgi:glycosyltransferase involved in cell wall biosynthesis